MDFYQFYNQVNGIPYADPRVPPPTSYHFLDYVGQLTKSKINNTEDGTYELTPLSQEDMCRYATDDVVDTYSKMHSKNPNSLGDPLDDEQFKKYSGM